MAKTVGLCFIAFVACGCNSGATKVGAPKTDVPAQAERQAGFEALELSGSGGKVKLGDARMSRHTTLC